MTNRERAMNILHFGDVDRLPAVHFGYWKELLFEWAEQGHIPYELAKSWGDSQEADKKLKAIDQINTYYGVYLCGAINLRNTGQKGCL